MEETINPVKLLTQIVPVLDKLQIPYFITGGFAVSVWGRPRATFDIDIVIKILEPEVNQLAAMLRKISEYGYIDENAMREAIKNRGEFNFIDPETGIKADFWVAEDDETTRMEYDRRVRQNIDDQDVYFISPEDLILNKFKWYQISLSNRHLEDVKTIFKVSDKVLNRDYLIKQSEKQKTRDLLNKFLE